MPELYDKLKFYRKYYSNLKAQDVNFANAEKIVIVSDDLGANNVQYQGNVYKIITA